MPKVTYRKICGFILCAALMFNLRGSVTSQEEETLSESEPDMSVSVIDETSMPEDIPNESEEYEGEEYVMFAPSAEIISPTEAVVTTFEDLNTVLSQDNGITTVYLGADIDMKSGGIVPHKNKKSFVIDGISPLDETGTKHKLSDHSSSAYTNCIRVEDANGAKNVTLRNLVIVGRNFYGTVYVADTVSNVFITYENIEYTGPQITYNRYGSARYINTSIVINSGNGGSAINEVAEIRHVELGGNVSIKHYSSGFRVFYFALGTGSVTVLDGADVNVTVNDASMSCLYGLSADFTVGKNASFKYSGKSAFNENSLTSLTVKEGGEFSVASSGTVVIPVLYMDGDINVKESASFKITAYSSLTRAVVRMGGNLLVERGAAFHIAALNGFSSAMHVFGGKTIEFRDPASVIFYNSSNTIVFYDMAGDLIINAQQINYWNAAGDGGFDNPPIYGWKKADGTNFIITGRVSLGITGNFTAISSNYTPGDFPGAAPTSASFNMAKAHMLSFGRLEITAEPFYESSVQVSGGTSPNADIRIAYTHNTVLTNLRGNANPDGTFTIPVNDALEHGTVIIIKSNINYLTAETEIAAEKAAETNTLEFLAVPNELLFETTALSSKTQLVGRQYPDWNIVVSDTRINGGQWRITARIIQPFTPVGSDEPPVLSDSLIFVDGSGVKTVLRQSGDTLIYHHTSAVPAEETVIGWAYNKGILAEIQPGSAYAEQAYNAVILWRLEDVP